MPDRWLSLQRFTMASSKKPTPAPRAPRSRPSRAKSPQPQAALLGRRRRNEHLEYGILQALDADDANPTRRKERREARRAFREDPNLRVVVVDRLQEELEARGEEVPKDRPILAAIIKYLPWVISMIFALKSGGAIPPFPG